MKNRLYVRNLAGDVSAGALQELFEQHGFVVDVKLLAMGKAGETVGVAFVILATDESAEAAVKALNGSSLHGVTIRVEVARDEGGVARRSTSGVV
jgi:RNA recognition motif-containing protein